MSEVPSNLIPTRITQLPTAPVASEDSLLLIVYQGNNYQIRAGDLLSVAGVPTSRQVIAGTGLTGGGQLLNNVTLSVATGGINDTLLSATGVTASTVGSATEVPVFTVNAQGRITAVSTVPVQVSGYVPTSREVIAGEGLAGGGMLNTNVTLRTVFGNSAPSAGFQSGSAGTSTESSRSDHQHPAVDLSSDDQVDNILGLSNGGTARSLVPDEGAIIWCGADGLYVGPVGGVGQIMQSTGAGQYQWVDSNTLEAASAADILGGLANQLVYQVSAGDTGFVVAPVSADTFLKWNGSAFEWSAVAGAGTVTSVSGSGGTTGMTLSGGPITSSGTLTLGGTLVVANGGTGATTAADARTNLDVPSKTGSGATGDWGINVLGNAATVTNGVYTTSSYSNPSWITSLATSKLSGTISNGQLANSSVTFNGQTVSLGGSGTITAANPYALTIGSGLTGTSYDGSSAVTITNAAPDQTVVLNNGTGISVTGTYPNFTITNTAPSSGGTVTSVGTGTGLTGGPITSSGTVDFAVAAVGTWAATPSSANLAAAMTDETGSGALVFANSPTLSGPTIDGSNPYVQFNNGSAVTLAAGRMWYNGTTGSLNFGMGGGNITQQVGEEIFVYGKASSAITEGQLVMKTGVVGASGVITFAPTSAGITDDNVIIGIATENIALNGFGRITAFGVVHGIDTSAFTDGATLWYDPTSSTGGMTATKPSAPNAKCEVGIVINAGSGGSGSIQVQIIHGTKLGGSDSNAQIGTPSNGQILTYDGAATYWKNTSLTAGSGISVSSASDGTLTIANTSPSSGGTVTSVSGTGTVSGISLSGTVTSSGSLTLGGALDLSSPPAIGGTSPNTIAGTTITGTAFVGINGGTF